MTENENQAIDFGMTDLEELLASKEGASSKAETLHILSSAGQRVKAQIDAGLPAERFEKAQKTYAAFAAAHEIVTHFPTGNASQD